MKTLMISTLCLLGLAACSGNGTSEGAAEKQLKEGPAAVAQRTVGLHTNIDYKQVGIVSVAAVDFSDSSLGCPQPGMAYLQVITPGHKIIAETSGPDGTQRFDVRVAGNHGLVCENRQKQKPSR
jgi:hypothetical protein